MFKAQFIFLKLEISQSKQRKEKAYFENALMYFGGMGFIYSIGKQPPNQMKIYLTDSGRNIHRWGDVLKSFHITYYVIVFDDFLFDLF